MKLEVTVSEIADIFKEIQERPGQLFEMIRLDIREVVGNYLTAMMNAELPHYLGREPYVRLSGEVNHRNGSYGRGFALKGMGEVHVDVPRDRKGEFRTSVIPRSKQYEEEVARDLSILFLAGISTRTLSMLSERLIGRRISPAEISSVSAELNGAVEAWRRCDLSGESIKYLFIDGVHFHMRMGRSIEMVPVLVAIGVTQTGRKIVLSLHAGDKESAFMVGVLQGLERQRIGWQSSHSGNDGWLTWFGDRFPGRVSAGQNPTLPDPRGPECSGQGAEEVQTGRGG